MLIGKQAREIVNDQARSRDLCFSVHDMSTAIHLDEDTPI